MLRSMKTKYSLSYRRPSLAWILRCNGLYVASDEEGINIQDISAEGREKTGYAATEAIQETKREVTTERNKDCA